MASVRTALEESIDAAKAAGLLDVEQASAPIEVARKLADMMDLPEWPIVNGKFDNVSPSVFLKYCEQMHLFDTPKGKEKKSALAELKVMAPRKKKAANA